MVKMAETEQKSRVSVVIVTYNSSDTVSDCIESILENYPLSKEIFVIDNASEDGSVGLIASRFPSVHMIVNALNRGFAAANNQAFPGCKGEYILFLNPDAALTSKALETMIGFMDQNRHIGLAGAKIVNPDGTLQESISYRYPGEKHTSGELNGMKGSIACVLGACMIARTDLIRKIGGFDEDYFLYGEDQELCLQVRRHGYEIGYITEAVIIHIGGHSERSSIPEELWKKKTRAEYIFYRKHYNPDTIRKITRAHRFKSWWRILTIHMTLPFLCHREKSQEKLSKYRAILQTLHELELKGV